MIRDILLFFSVAVSTRKSVRLHPRLALLALGIVGSCLAAAPSSKPVGILTPGGGPVPLDSTKFDRAFFDPETFDPGFVADFTLEPDAFFRSLQTYRDSVLAPRVVHTDGLPLVIVAPLVVEAVTAATVFLAATAFYALVPEDLFSDGPSFKAYPTRGRMHFVPLSRLLDALFPSRSDASNSSQGTAAGGGKPPSGHSTQKQCVYPTPPRGVYGPGDLRWLGAYPHRVDRLVIRENTSRPGKSSPPDLAKWSRDAGLKLSLEDGPLLAAYVVTLPESMTALEAATLTLKMRMNDSRGAPGHGCRYDYIEPDWIMEPMADLPDPNDPIFPEQWNLRGIPVNLHPDIDTLPAQAGFTDAWNHLHAFAESGGRIHEVRIAVLDGGFAFKVPERIPNSFPRITGMKQDTTSVSQELIFEKVYSAPLFGPAHSCPADSACHGTIVAGVLAAQANNRYGISGALGLGVSPHWDTKTFPLTGYDVFPPSGVDSEKAHSSVVMAAALHAGGVAMETSCCGLRSRPTNPRPARVLNISLGGDEPCPVYWQDVVASMHDRGIIVVAAAGNEDTLRGGLTAQAPASCRHVIQVTAHSLGLRQKSSYYTGDSLNAISAPGIWVPVFKAYGARIEKESGTSAATPHVAAAIAMMLAVRPQLTRDQILWILQESGTPGFSGVSYRYFGRGQRALNAGKAVRWAIGSLNHEEVIPDEGDRAKTPSLPAPKPRGGPRPGVPLGQ